MENKDIQALNLRRILNRIQNNSSAKEAIEKAKKYYKNENEILSTGAIATRRIDPLRSANNKIPHNFHEILTDEKASYLFTFPILIDIDDNEDLNNKVSGILGEDYSRKLKNQCVEATNAGTSWVHYWVKNNKQNETDPDDFEFKYSLIPSEQIIPIYDDGLDRELSGIIRYFSTKEYKNADSVDLEVFSYVEYWTKEKCEAWKFDNSNYMTEGYIDYKTFSYDFGEVPFIEFANNSKRQSDLMKYLLLVDLYDRVFSGFANDLDDIQEIIYILENYTGTDLKQFKKDIQESKVLSVDSSEGSKGDLRTLQIDIPVEARKTILELLKNQIYESGQGLQQDQENFGNASGVALKFFYRRLELKAGLMETEFRSGINRLIKAILRYLNVTEYNKISQTWARNMITNDADVADIINKSANLVDGTTLLENHPLVDDVQKVLDRKEKEEASLYSDYNFEELTKNSEES